MTEPLTSPPKLWLKITTRVLIILSLLALTTTTIVIYKKYHDSMVSSRTTPLAVYLKDKADKDTPYTTNWYLKLINQITDCLILTGEQANEPDMICRNRFDTEADFAISVDRGENKHHSICPSNISAIEKFKAELQKEPADRQFLSLNFKNITDEGCLHITSFKFTESDVGDILSEADEQAVITSWTHLAKAIKEQDSRANFEVINYYHEFYEVFELEI